MKIRLTPISVLLFFTILSQLVAGCATGTVPRESPTAAMQATRLPAETSTVSEATSSPTSAPTTTSTSTSTLSPTSTSTPIPVRSFPSITLSSPAGPFKLYKHIDLAVESDGSVANPFDPAQADLQVVFTSPSGKKVQTTAFWFQDFDPQSLKPVGEAGWRVRFTPTEPGRWVAQAKLLVPASLESAELELDVQPDPNAHGFVRLNPQDAHYLSFDDGTFYFPIGLNVAWSNQDVLKDYQLWLDHLSQNGGNYIRVWMASWSFGIEWQDTGLGNYSNRLKQAWLLDQVFSLSEERGIYIMLCLVNHGAFSERTNPEWDSNPYNAALGGPLKQPQDFVTDPTARDYFRRRVRYIASRWGYSTNLAVWEWWNEINWTPIDDNQLPVWIAEMTTELRKYDPNNHLISTSYSDGTNNSIWAIPELNIAQQHQYSPNDPLLNFPSSFQTFQSNNPHQPVLMGEFGSSASGEDSPYNSGGLHLHNGLWAAPFSGYAGTAMYWWWDNYIEPKNLWFQYKGIASFLEGEHLEKSIVEQIPVLPEGATAALLKKNKRVLVWVRADLYNLKESQYAYEKALKKGSVPTDWVYQLPTQEGRTVKIKGLKDGSYRVIWYSTLEGETGSPTQVVVQNGSITIQLPSFTTDLAFKLVPAE